MKVREVPSGRQRRVTEYRRSPLGGMLILLLVLLLETPLGAAGPEGTASPSPQDASPPALSSSDPPAPTPTPENAPRTFVGSWYELSLECPFCLHFEDQKISLDHQASAIRYADRLEVAAEHKGATFFVRRGNEWTSRPAQVFVNERRDQLTIIQYVEELGQSTSFRYATAWVMSPMAGRTLIFGRRYEIASYSDSAFERTLSGYKASPDFLPPDKILANLEDVRVFSLNEERKIYQPGDQVRFSLEGVACFAREQITSADLERAQGEGRERTVQDTRRKELAETLIRQGDKAYADSDFEDALNRYKAASAIAPDMALVHADLGAVYQVMNRLLEAEAAYRLALTLEPNDIDTLYNLGQVLEEQARPRDALQVFTKVLESRAEDAEAQDKVNRLRRKLGVQ